MGGALLAVAVAGCGLIQSSQRIGMDNGTDIPIQLHVNGAWVGTYAPGATADAPLGGHGGPSYAIQLLSPSGAVLGSWDVTAEEMELIDEDGEGISWDVAAPCGSIHLWIGDKVGPTTDPSPSYAPCP